MNVEKGSFVGTFVGSILYGIVVTLFFRSMVALFDPAYRRGEGIKWGLVSYTVAMLLFVTMFTAMNLNSQSISFIDNREFRGVPPGPIGYQSSAQGRPKVFNIISSIMFILNNWFADGFLVYRCYIIYSMNLWAIAFPCLVYLCSLMAGTAVLVTQVLMWDKGSGQALFHYRHLYLSISVSTNILLTLMIVIRLVLYARNVRTAMGVAGIDGSCKAIVTILVESSALFTVSSLLVVGPSGDGPAYLFLLILAETQVIAPLLIIQRVASKNASTSNTLVFGSISEFRARSRGESADGGGVLPGGDSMSPADEHGMNSVDAGIDVETRIYFHQDDA